MNRYWKLISLATVIVLVIGTFYIKQTGAASSMYPDFIFEKKSGNDDELDGLILDGSYNENGSRDNYLQINANSTTYYNTLSFFDRLGNPFLNDRIKRYEKDYRNFMRGKNRWNAGFFENEDTLVYANVAWGELFNRYQPTDFKFDIDILNKNTKGRTTFELAIPGQEKYDQIRLEGVHLMEDELKVFTSNSGYDRESQSNINELHVYGFDFGKKQLIRDEVVVTASVERGWVSVYALNSEGAEPHNYIVFAKRVEELIEQSDGSFIEEIKEKELIAFNLETDEQKVIELPEGIESTDPESFYDDTLYFKTLMEDHFEVTAYNLVTKKAEKEQFELPKMYEEFAEPVVRIQNGKVYTVSPDPSDSSNAWITIKDIASGTVLYEGLVKPGEANPKNKTFELIIDSIGVE